MQYNEKHNKVKNPNLVFTYRPTVYLEKEIKNYIACLCTISSSHQLNTIVS